MKQGEFLPQFAAQCVASLSDSAKKLASGAFEISNGSVDAPPSRVAEVFEFIAWLIKEHAECFVLPHNAEIYRPHSQVIKREEIASTIGLPAPVCTFEFYTDSHKSLYVMMEKDCFESGGGPQPASSEKMVAVFYLFFDEVGQRWVPVDKIIQLPLPIECPVDGGLMFATHNLYTHKKLPTNECYQELAFAADILAQVCTALRAGAKTVEHVEKSPSRRAKFESQGAGGIVYKTLVMPGDKQYASIPSASAGGTHASPRHHFRRGHIRQLPTGVLTWVRHCFVGSRESGEVLKNYKLEAAQ